jgi:starch synthase (maltosyl-transferring)
LLVGPVERWTEQLPRIAGMAFDWVYVNPFHETGYSGSLYAVKDYYRLNPRFRGSASDDDAAIAGFVDAARAHGLRVMMDLVVNHTARDAGLVEQHPEWYRRDASGAIRSPSATDPADPSNETVWTDLAELNYDERPARDAMVDYFAGVVRHYAGLGIAGFRCDAAYKVPAAVWAVLRRAAREVEPEAVFAAENLGAPIEAVRALRPAGFDYLFNSSKWWDFHSPWLLEQYEEFRQIAPSIAFPESHDTPRLATELGERTDAEVEAEYRFRYLFAAFFSAGVMLPIGYEYGFRRALDVVMTSPEDWERPRFDISDFIREVNEMKAAAPALREEGPQREVATHNGATALLRAAASERSYAVALVNPAPTPTRVTSDVVLGAIDGSGPPVEVTPDVPHVPLAPSAPIDVAPFAIRVFVAGGGAAPPAVATPVAIEHAWPDVDDGRYPVKRVAGDRLVVTADIFREGHDRVGAVVKYRREGELGWRETPMTPLENDRWRGTFTLDRIGRYRYTIEAWPDAFGSWRADTEKKRAAGQPIALELIEGRGLVAAALARAPERERARLALRLRELDGAGGDEDRAALLLDPELEQLVGRVPDRSHAAVYDREIEVIVDRPAARFAAWYELFPRSYGTFADAARQLPRIRAMGFDVVYLPPIHPIGEAFRKGRNNALAAETGDPGSPWAIGSAAGGHTSVHPELGTLADFEQFVAAARAAGLEVALDYALQCSPDHPWVREHPEWFAFRPDGSIKYAENPPKKYQDIVNFNWYGPHAPALWSALRDVVEFWVGRGVRTFRVDNPHTKPFAFWAWMIADVRERHPDVLFLAEAFTRPKVMQHLAKAGFSQSYTYFTWRNFRDELTRYVEELAHSAMAEYYRPNFWPNTPDILAPVLQTGGRPAFVMRLVLAATLSSLYGIYSGFELCENAALPGTEEYANSEKYELRRRDFDAPRNIVAEITRLNAIRRENPALQDWRNIRFLDGGADNVLFYLKQTGANALLIAVNLDPLHPVDAVLHLPLDALGIEADETFACDELLSGERFVRQGALLPLRLDPARRVAAIFRVDARLRVPYESPSD